MAVVAAVRSGSDLNLPRPSIVARSRSGTGAAGSWHSIVTAAGPELTTSALLGCFTAAAQVAARDPLAVMCSAAAYFS